MPDDVRNGAMPRVAGGLVSAAPTTFRDASFVCTVGRTASGKTVDSIASFPRAMVFALTRELKSAITVLGYHPEPRNIHVARTLYDVEAGVDALLEYRAKKDPGALFHNAVLIDDLTVLAYQTEQALREGVNVAHRGNLKPRGWDLWTEQRNFLLILAFRIAEKCRQAGVHLAVNGHLRTGRVNPAGKVLRGGIDLPTDLTESFTAGTDLCALIEPEGERLWHPSIFRVANGDSYWATKNRYGLSGMVPSNTAEILRAAGYYLPRAPGHEAHEEYVEKLAGYVMATLGVEPYTRANLQKVISGPTRELASVVPNPLHARWIIRDAIDRAYLRREKTRGIYLEAGVSF